MTIRKWAIGAALLALSVGAAVAIQPGTTGTEKRFQQQGLRSGVLIQKNNTATAASNAVTLNAAGSGIITTESLTLIPGSAYLLTLTNSMIQAADMVFVSVGRGTSTRGVPYVRRVQEAAGLVVIDIGNSNENAAEAFNGTLRIKFLVVKQSVDGAD